MEVVGLFVRWVDALRGRLLVEHRRLDLYDALFRELVYAGCGPIGHGGLDAQEWIAVTASALPRENDGPTVPLDVQTEIP